MTDAMIQVELRLLAAMRKLLPEENRSDGIVRLAASESTTLAGFLESSGIDRGRALVVLLNGRHAGPDSELAHGDVVTVFPPLAGG